MGVRDEGVSPEPQTPIRGGVATGRCRGPFRNGYSRTNTSETDYTFRSPSERSVYSTNCAVIKIV